MLQAPRPFPLIRLTFCPVVLPVARLVVPLIPAFIIVAVHVLVRALSVNLPFLEFTIKRAFIYCFESTPAMKHPLFKLAEIFGLPVYGHHP